MLDGKNENATHYMHGKYETIDEMLMLFTIEEVMAFCKLNVWKYRARAMYKNGEDDMEKADDYLTMYESLKGMCNER